MVGKDCLSGTVEEARRCAYSGVDGYQFVGESEDSLFYFKSTVKSFLFLSENNRLPCCGRKFSISQFQIAINPWANISGGGNSADMAFLAINDINIEAQLGSLISTALALSSIICALLQIRQHRGRTGAQSHEVVSNLSSLISSINAHIYNR